MSLSAKRTDDERTIDDTMLIDELKNGAPGHLYVVVESKQSQGTLGRQSHDLLHESQFDFIQQSLHIHRLSE